MVAPISDDVRSLVVDLHEIGAVKFGTFTLKSGIQSPFYVDLRLTVSHPAILQRVATELQRLSRDVPHEVLCGVPYTALPFATAMSLSSGKPMVMRRKEAKGYGTKKIIEGVWNDGDKCLIVEDLVTSGLSVMETVEPLVEAGMAASDVVVLLNREQGAKQNLEKKGITLHAVLGVSTLVDVLVSEGRLEESVAESVRAFVATNQVVDPEEKKKEEVPCTKSDTGTVVSAVTFEQRAEQSTNAMLTKLFKMMAEKKSNLAVAADVTTKAELLALADAVGPHICVLKTHADIVEDWDRETGAGLRAAAEKHNFLVFEDRKFADIGNTVLHQCAGGFHRIAEWADIVNAHSVPGPGIISGLEAAANESGRTIGLLLLAQMSSEGNLASGLDGYTSKTVEMAEKTKGFVCGFISQGKLAGDDFVYMTPGVKLEKGGDTLGQQYNTPGKVVAGRGTDIIIVGRGIYGADDKTESAKTYQQAGWVAYTERLANAATN